MVGAVILATGTVEFEGGLKSVNHLKAKNSLQRVHTISEINATINSRFVIDQVFPILLSSARSVVFYLQLLLLCKDFNWPGR